MYIKYYVSYSLESWLVTYGDGSHIEGHKNVSANLMSPATNVNFAILLTRPL